MEENIVEFCKKIEEVMALYPLNDREFVTLIQRYSDSVIAGRSAMTYKRKLRLCEIRATFSGLKNINSMLAPAESASEG